MSGPGSGRAIGTPAPRRISGPSRHHGWLAVRSRATRVLRGLPDHPLLDRIVRGRAWIPLLGVMLAGIVAMQVEVLKLGASMGRAIEQSSALQSRNELLRASVATLADDQRIERLAAGMGMVMPAPSEVGFLSRRAGNPRRAVANIHQADAATFANSLAELEAAARAVSTPAASTTTVTAGTATTPAVSQPTPVAAPSGATSAASGYTPTPTTTTPQTAPIQAATPTQTAVPVTPAAPTSATTQTSAASGGAAAAAGG